VSKSTVTVDIGMWVIPKYTMNNITHVFNIKQNPNDLSEMHTQLRHQQLVFDHCRFDIQICIYVINTRKYMKPRYMNSQPLASLRSAYS